MRDRENGAGRPQEENELVFLALGGLGEIGMNVYLYGFGPEGARRWLMVDLGITFPGEAEPGADVVLPDLRFIMEERQALAGIVLTHGHEDHIGAVIDLWPELRVPLFATRFTANLLRSKLAEFGSGPRPEVTEVPAGGRFSVGPFDLEFVNVAHSIPESQAVAIRTPMGLVLHSGDWKLDADPPLGPMPQESRLAELGREGVLALICDSTNALREGHSPSEREAAKALRDVIAKAPGRVAVTTFSSNIARIKAIADAAAAAGRRLVVAGRALHRVIAVAIESGYLPAGFEYLDQDMVQSLPAREVVILCTGSQGEPRAAIARISEQGHPAITLEKGDTVIFSSRTIPGNEKAVGRVQNNLVRLGCEVITDEDAPVHVTGHPRRGELRQMYAWVRPRAAIPMHGEMRHLSAHMRLAKEAGVPHVLTAVNGEIVRLAPGVPALIDEAPTGRRYRDGALIVPGAEGPVAERRRLAAAGLVAVAFAVSRRGEMISEPEIALEGVPVETASGEPMAAVIAMAIEGTLASIPAAQRKDIELVREAVRRAVRAAVAQAWGKRPICRILIVGAG